MLGGVFWTALATYSGFFFQLAVSAILARLLRPEEFGLVALCMVALAFFGLFTDMGLGSGIVQKRDLTAADYNSLFTLTLYAGVVVAAALCLAAPAVARLYNEPQLVTCLRLLSIVLLLSCWGVVPGSLLVKWQRFKFMSLRALVFQILTGCLGCLAAWAGWGIYALLVGPLVSGVGVFIVNLVASGVRPVWRIDLKPFKAIFAYSAWQFLFTLTNYLSRNADKMLIGKCLNLTQLGYYEKGYRLALLPMEYLAGVINPVVHPVLAPLQDDRPEQTRQILRIVEVVALLCFPVAVLCAFGAREAVLLIFGPQWGPAIPCFVILSLSIGFQGVNRVTGAFYMAAGATRDFFWVGLWCSLFTLAMVAGSALTWRSIEAVAAGFVVGWIGSWAIALYWLFHKVLPTPADRLWRAYLPAAKLTALTLLVLGASELLLPYDNLWLSAAVKVALFLAVAGLFAYRTGFIKLLLLWRKQRRSGES